MTHSKLTVKTGIIAILIIFAIGFASWVGTNEEAAITNLDNAAIEPYLHELNGSGNAWEVSGYRLAAAQTSIIRGGGELIFLGDPNHLSRSHYFSFRIFSRQGDSEKTLLTSTRSSSNGPLNMPGRLALGSIESDRGDQAEASLLQELANTFIEIEWEDASGARQSEVIQMKGEPLSPWPKAWHAHPPSLPS